VWALLDFWDFHADVRPTTVQPQSGYELFRRMVAGEFSPTEGVPSPRGIRLTLLRGVGKLYVALMPWFALVGLAGAGWAAVRAIAARSLPPLALVGSALAGSIAVRLLLLAYIEVTSFPAMNILYLAPLFPMFLLLCALGLHEGVAALPIRAARAAAP
jgi:hypothetical protein